MTEEYNEIIDPYPWYPEDTLLKYIKKKLVPENDSTLESLYTIVSDNNNLSNYDIDITYDSHIPSTFMHNWRVITDDEKIEKPLIIKNYMMSLRPIADNDFIFRQRLYDTISGFVRRNLRSIIINDFYVASYSFNIPLTKKERMIWLSSKAEISASYILNKTFLYRDYFKDKKVSLFLQRVSVPDTLNIVFIDSKMYKELLIYLGVNQHILTYELEAIAEWILDVNKVFQGKNIIPKIDGVAYINKKNDIIMSLVGVPKSIFIKNTLVYKKDNKFYEEIPKNSSEYQLKKVFEDFYQPPTIKIESNYQRFRYLLARSIKHADRDVEQKRGDEIFTNITNLLTTGITNALRPLIYDAICNINEKMKEYGQLVCAGGDAINMQVAKSDRAVSPDIDTKFIIRNLNKLSESDYFLTLIKTRQVFWELAIQDIIDKWNSETFYKDIYYNLLQPLESLFPFNMLNVVFLRPKQILTNVPFIKRFTPIIKNTQKVPQFLFNTDLFAIDLNIFGYYNLNTIEDEDGEYRYYPEMEHYHNPCIPGILDMPFVRPKHLGSDLDNPSYINYIEVNNQIRDELKNITTEEEEIKVETLLEVDKNITSLNETQYYKKEINTISKKIVLPVANRRYTIKDAKLLFELGLRTGEKRQKDEARIKLLEKYLTVSEQKYSSMVNTVLEQDSNEIKIPDLTKEIDMFKMRIYDIGCLKLTQIVKFIAPPDVNDLFELDNRFDELKIITNGFIACPEKAALELTAYDSKFESIMNDIYMKFDTGDVYNYTSKTWDRCPKNDYENLDVVNCDKVYNIYDFRFNALALSGWENSDSLSYINMKCILDKLYLYLSSIRKESIEVKNEKLGALLYGFRPALIKKYKSDITPVLASNILLYAYGLQFIFGDLEKICKKIYNILNEIKNTKIRQSKRLKY